VTLIEHARIWRVQGSFPGQTPGGYPCRQHYVAAVVARTADQAIAEITTARPDVTVHAVDSPISGRAEVRMAMAITHRPCPKCGDTATPRKDKGGFDKCMVCGERILE
jgi:predicted RNA-binding Zn-ribbon protein involved in translation (DUF1610 family)